MSFVTFGKLILCAAILLIGLSYKGNQEMIISWTSMFDQIQNYFGFVLA